MSPITVVILAYNEEARIGEVLEGLRGLHIPGLKVVVVDDGSIDGTAEVARSFADRLALEVVCHPKNLGVARTFETGLRFAARRSGPSDVIVTMEGDGTNDPETVARLARCIWEGADVVCASRYRPGGGYYGFPLKRKILSLGANYFMRWYFGIPDVRDYTLFCRAYQAKVIQDALARYNSSFIECEGFVSNVEILVKISRMDRFRFGEVAMRYSYEKKRSKSGMRVWKNLREYVRFFKSNVDYYRGGRR
ncbi:MAG: glycosyltransferase [Candidatus Rokubacteria bacterium]|nr:glycosyltransferase [Candidatus Rokubacteria bacterium]MBI3456121.1 glycosyltransferase [Candidatus Rokubacteria bacterium]